MGRPNPMRVKSFRGSCSWKDYTVDWLKRAYEHDDDPKQNTSKGEAIAKAMEMKEKSPRAYARLKTAYNKKFGGSGVTFEEAVAEEEVGLAMSDPSLGVIPAKVKADAVVRVENVIGAETGEYPHIAPVKQQVSLEDNRVAKSIEGLPLGELAAVLAEHEAKKSGEPKQVECKEVETEDVRQKT